MKKLLVILLLTSVALAAYAADATIVSISGTVEIREPGGSWTPASVGQVVSANSWISTGFGSRAKVSAGGMEMSLQPLTRVSISSLAPESGASGTSRSRTTVSLQTGRVRATRPPTTRANRRDSIDFRVSTPVATAAVRGTDFVISFNKLVTYEGLVSYSQEGVTVMSPGGTYTWAVDGWHPVDPGDLVDDQWAVNPTAGSIPGSDGRGGRSRSTRNLGYLDVTID